MNFLPKKLNKFGQKVLHLIFLHGKITHVAEVNKCSYWAGSVCISDIGIFEHHYVTKIIE